MIPNPLYNPNFQVLRWSGLPLYRNNATRGRKAGFHIALEESIERDGVRNPICAYEIAGKLYVTYGASRVGAVRRIFERGQGDGLVPTILSGPTSHNLDLIGVKGDFIDLSAAGADDLLKRFVDPPKTFTIEKEGFLTFLGCKGAWDAKNNPEPENLG